MKKFRKKPIVIDAVQFLPEHKESVREIQHLGFSVSYSDGRAVIKIQTLEGEMTASEGDWLIKGLRGEFYPCKPDIFDKSYEEVTT